MADGKISTCFFLGGKCLVVVNESMNTKTLGFKRMISEDGMLIEDVEMYLQSFTRSLSLMHVAWQMMKGEKNVFPQRLRMKNTYDLRITPDFCINSGTCFTITTPRQELTATSLTNGIINA